MIIKLAFAFGAGFISFLTPCVLPIIPGYISYITGKDLGEIDKNKSIVLTKTILFSLGFSFVFITLGRFPLCFLFHGRKTKYKSSAKAGAQRLSRGVQWTAAPWLPKKPNKFKQI